jgi:Animal haem peroxidase
LRRFHGAKLSLSWFPFPGLISSCADRFGYMSSAAVRTATRLPFNAATQVLLGHLGGAMGDPGRDPNPSSNNPADAGVSVIPAGFTYFGQFVDHDITLDISSSLEADTDANTINNMRSPALDLDSLYSRGPGLDPFMYSFPTSEPPTAIKCFGGRQYAFGRWWAEQQWHTRGDGNPEQLGRALVAWPLTAIIGDPRNDENLIVVQFHHAMLRFHNAVVDLLLAAEFTGDIFAEAKRIVTHHYQWAVVHDYLKRVCGTPAVDTALATVVAPIGIAFRMPVEFVVAAYRFGHSMIRDNYWVNFSQPFASLGNVFAFNRVPRLPVLSNWVVDFNAFFDTGILLNKTPLWYYILREAAVLGGGNQMGPVGGRIVAETFVRLLKRDASSFLNVGGGFAPMLPSATAGNFTVADLVTFAGVTQP